MIIAATGHRPEKLGGYTPEAVTRRYELAMWFLQHARPAHVISGVALGWDQAVAVAAYDLGIPFTAAVPFAGQGSRWPLRSQEIYRELLRIAARVVIVSEGGFSAAAMQRRNEWMVDNCDALVALWDGSSGGTGNCVTYANKIGRPGWNLWQYWR
jgi:uncharacterized phage-like protein YoqJ